MIFSFKQYLVSCTLLILGTCLLVSQPVMAMTPNQFGSTGLLSQPTAQTLNEGNICVGLWANCFDGVDNEVIDSDSGIIIPATITMGLGTFIEAYASYPNLLFNGDEDGSGRGYANGGFKLRVYGKRSDPFRLGLDLFAKHSVSDESELDALTDYGSRLIASLKLGRFGLHANAGYVFNESPDIIDYDDQVVMGAGVEFYPDNRIRAIAEYSYETEKADGLDGPSEVMVGLQYFLTPHLTVNIGTGVGLSDASPDWRVLFGLSTCQGVGFFNRPIPKLIDPEDTVEDVEEAPKKVIKIRALTPLALQSKVKSSPVSHLEIPISILDQQALVDPGDRMETPKLASLDASAVSPIGQRPPSRTLASLPSEPFAANVVRMFRFPQFAFDLNQWDLSPKGEEALSQVAEELRADDRYFIISIEGHTDDIGPESYNMNLSFRRAVNAATHLVLRNGIDPARIFVKAFGESRPIADNNTQEGRSQNRRVDLKVMIPEGYEEHDYVAPASGSSKSGVSSQKTKQQDDADSPDHATPKKQDTETAKGAKDESPAVSGLKQAAPVDALSIEQAINEKTGSPTLSPTGAFSRSEEK
ncbi:MAG: OmpA family protein [Deltaproteobacteria bacterium]|nr:OmpA family protein [Deltaproteobacteria bacterium]